MDKVAGDLLNNVLEFLGVLLPGVIFAYLHSTLLLAQLTSNTNTAQAQMLADWSWVPALIVSLILGHILHAFSDPLDDLAAWFCPDKKTQAYFTAAKATLDLPEGAPETAKNYFYFAFSFIRIHHAGAVAELERQAGNYKFFRSLVLLFVLDIPLSLLDPYVSRITLPSRLTVLLLAAGLAAIVAKLLFEWTYQLGFELYLHVRGLEEKQAAKPEASSKANV